MISATLRSVLSRSTRVLGGSASAGPGNISAATGTASNEKQSSVGSPTGRFAMPEDVSAFTVIGLLEKIDAKNGLSPPQREELRTQIRELEGFYFREGEGETPDLRRIAESWVQRVS